MTDQRTLLDNLPYGLTIKGLRKRVIDKLGNPRLFYKTLIELSNSRAVVMSKRGILYKRRYI